MNAVNFQASVNNLTQVDRLHQDAHRGPVVNQEQNAEIARDEVTARMAKPVQPDQIEGKNIDPEDHRRKDREKKKRPPAQERPAARSDERSGHFVDIDA